jgi:hypothetical protein
VRVKLPEPSDSLPGYWNFGPDDILSLILFRGFL